MHTTPERSGRLCDLLLWAPSRQGFQSFLDQCKHPCDLLLVPGRHSLIPGEAMFENHRPAVWVVNGKVNVDLAQLNR